MKVTFFHRGGPEMASYRYRAQIPARELGASLNQGWLASEVFIYAKPSAAELVEAKWLQKAGGKIVADFCDDHFDHPHYMEFLELADAVTCPTKEMARIIKNLGRDADVIFDPYEFPEALPHMNDKVLWFGHGSNFAPLQRILGEFDNDLTVVSNLPLAMPWSLETLRAQFHAHGIMILPAGSAYKSANRAVEAIRQGCFVVAEPHPSLEGFEGIWLGDIPEGIAWASTNPSKAYEWTQRAQKYVKERFSPQTQASAWKKLFEKVKSPSTSGAGNATGMAGSTSMDSILEPT
jgi:hypothetical protein